LIKLVIYTLLGIILSTLLAWLMGHYLLRSMRQLIYATQQISVQQLDQRIKLPARTIEVQQLTEAVNAMLTESSKAMNSWPDFLKIFLMNYERP
jgi:Signal transduction histidine kinase involved in nitrogen fixation and metabolism regulation